MDGLSGTRRTQGHQNLHHKTGAVVLHPLQDGDGTLFYGDAEEVLAKVRVGGSR